MERNFIKPDFVFESSWEVCNKVGGIYTVLSTRAKTLQQALKDKIVFIGPDCWKDKKSPYFTENEQLFADWRNEIQVQGLHVKIGRWNIPGQPIVFLIDFEPFFLCKDQIYTELWRDFGVDSLHAYGDYDEASMFSYAAALVVESFYNKYLHKKDKVIYHGNEWMTGLGLLYIKKHVPKIGTIFTTHATSIGRSIAGNNKPLYDYLWAYNGDQMAGELNMQSKHSIEKQTAANVDCFTTVSDITARECAELLDKKVDVILPNGFDNSFVPISKDFEAKRKKAREVLLNTANALLGTQLKDDTLIVSTSGRYEFRNKGIDVFIDAMNRLRHDSRLNNNKVLAFVEVPAWVSKPREDLKHRLKGKAECDGVLECPILTHWLHNMDSDNVLGMMRSLNMNNQPEDNVYVIFVPCYLTGDDGIFNQQYYDLILGNDLSIFPSYYEPWGYTPLESIAFKVPCVTTDLAGFGLWVNQEIGKSGELSDGVKVIHRTDSNYHEVADTIKDTILEYSTMTAVQRRKCRSSADRLSKKALWKHFITYYYKAYNIAIDKAKTR